MLTTTTKKDKGKPVVLPQARPVLVNDLIIIKNYLYSLTLF